jgi:hypothetical protein
MAPASLLTAAITRQPRAASEILRCLPTKPFAPVIKTLFADVFKGSGLSMRQIHQFQDLINETVQGQIVVLFLGQLVVWTRVSEIQLANISRRFDNIDPVCD